MADARRRHPGNAPGPWFVDDSCIDCDVSRQCAPWMFGSAGGQAVVIRQPATDGEEREASRALLSCPTGSIGVSGARPRRDVLPLEVAPAVFYLGYSARSSFGASSYLAVRPDGNLLVDAPRWAAPVVAAIEARGGIGHVLLTHRDDVADAERYAARFGARVWIHRADADAAPFASDVFDGDADAEIAVAPGVVAVPCPGHTRGSAVFLADDVLFTGDSLYLSRATGSLAAFRDATWFSWTTQARSLARLARLDFAHVLPGHGGRGSGDPAGLRRQLLALVAAMGRQPGPDDSEW
jgi:glyoxylase-like metal-dependent hydrolase (beta-lactamase superfamily II)